MQNRSFSEEWFDMLMLIDSGEGHKKYTQLNFGIWNVVFEEVPKRPGSRCKAKMSRTCSITKIHWERVLKQIVCFNTISKKSLEINKTFFVHMK